MPLRRTAEPGFAAALSVPDTELEFYTADDSSGGSDGEEPIILPIVALPTKGSLASPTNWAPPINMSSASSQDTQETQETAPTIITQPTLGPLQEKGLGQETTEFEPIDEDDPQSFDLTAAAPQSRDVYSLEARSEQLFSTEHLETIFSDPSLLLGFTNYLSKHRPQSVPILIYYLDALKALKAIAYANAVSEGLEPLGNHDFTHHAPQPSKNPALEEKAAQAFDVLVREDLSAFITHAYVNIVSVSIQKRITGTLAPHLREASEGLAEVFCLTDFNKPDNPIVFTSEEFHRTTQYGLNYVIGKNCRFLQGPKTSRDSVRRIGQAVKLGKEHQEVFLNYRRDGSPFMNLLTVAPLCDSRGKIRYFIGAQVDVSGLVKDCTDLESLNRLVRRARRKQFNVSSDDDDDDDDDTINEISERPRKDEFQELSEMLNVSELETVRLHGGRMHSELADADDRISTRASNRPRLLIKEPSGDIDGDQQTPLLSTRGRLPGVYQHYLLLRPHPSLRIIFTSPSLRVPGLLQSPFLNRIGGSQRVREELVAALAEGRNVTAKIRWLNRSDEEGRSRWVHCTPLIGSNGAVGSWMVVLVDDEREVENRKLAGEAGIGMAGMGGRWRQAPVVERDIVTSREKEREMPKVSRESRRDRGSGSGSQSSWPLRDDSHSLRSLKSLAHANGQHDEEHLKLREGARREHATQAHSPRAESHMASRFGRGGTHSQEHLVRAWPSKERLNRDPATAPLNKSRGGSRVNSRNGSSGESFAF